MANSAEALKAVLHNLSAALTYTEPSSVETNRKLWDRYAENYYVDKDANTGDVSEWVSTMASHVNRAASHLSFIGDEWSDEASLTDTLDAFLLPHLQPHYTVMELGIGGGRVADRVAPLCQSLIGVDISAKMIDRCKHSLASHANIAYHLLPSATISELPSQYHHSIDFLYSFDVLVHCDLHTIYHYLQQLRLVLKPRTGRAFLSVANLTSPLGWQRFERQKKYSEAGFYFLTPDMMRFLCAKAGFSIVNESRPDASSSNIYINRDYLVVIEPVQSQSPSQQPASEVSAHNQQRTEAA